MTARSLSGVLILLILAHSSLALDPTKSIHQYVHDVWGIEQGLPQNTVRVITQTQNGYVWIGTEEGLARFDGARFVVYDRSNTPQLKNNDVQALMEDREGKLWIGTRRGVVCLQNGQFKNFRFPEVSITSLYEAKSGNIWIGTRADGLSVFKNAKTVTYTKRHGLSSDQITYLHEDTDGTLWIGTRDGLNRFKDGKFSVINQPEILHAYVFALRSDQLRNLWIGTLTGLFGLKDGNVTKYGTQDGLSNEVVYSLFEDRDKNLWVGTWGGGLNRFREGKFSSYSTKEGLSSDLVYSFYEDRESNLWVGTANGLNQFKDGKFTPYTVGDGLSNNDVRSLTQDAHGNIWMGTSSGLNCFDSVQWTRCAASDLLNAVFIWSLHPDRRGSLWIGTDGSGLYQLTRDKLDRFTKEDGLSSDIIRAVLEDRKGNLWIGTRGGGLNRFHDGKFIVYSPQDGFSSDTVWALLEDQQGYLWMGTEADGLYRFRDNRFELFTTKHGLSNDTILSLYEDREGTLWIGTWGGGLNRFKGGKFTTYTTQNGLFDDLIIVILEDSLGYFWMSSNKGIFRVNKKQLNDFADGKIQRITSIPYGTSDGMKTTQCNGASQPAGWKTTDGRLMFATIQGAVVINPENIRTNQDVPPVVVERLITDNQTLSLENSKALELAPGNEKLEFHYTALSFTAPKKVLFKYKLDGYERDWIDSATRRVAYYTNIPPGRYVFRVKACNNDGIWNEAGASFAFRLKPYFYQTGWFYAVCVLFAGFAGWQIHQLRLKRLLEMERIRTRIATDLHDDIGAGLTRISILAEVMRQSQNSIPPAFGKSLSKIADASRELIAAMSDIVWSVDPEKDHVRDLLLRMRAFARDVFESKDIRLQFHVHAADDQLTLDPSQRRHIYLIFKEAINNIARHSECTEVEISLTQTGNYLLLQIKDNGKGYDATDGRSDFGGQGLKSMKKRAEEIAGRLQIHPGISCGTIVSLEIPLS